MSFICDCNATNYPFLGSIQILALAVCAVSAIPVAQQPEERVLVDELTTTTTPVPIIKSINKVNDDGSYTFGYEAGDGSFRIEKKELDGHVKGNKLRSCLRIWYFLLESSKIKSFFLSNKGKYGYVDEFGVLQVLGMLRDPFSANWTRWYESELLGTNWFLWFIFYFVFPLCRIRDW